MTPIIGYIATIITLLSFTFSNMKMLRITGCIACVLWILYAIMRNDVPLVLTNVAIIIIHFFYFLKRKS